MTSSKDHGRTTPEAPRIECHVLSATSPGRRGRRASEAISLNCGDETGKERTEMGLIHLVYTQQGASLATRGPEQGFARDVCDVC